MALPIPYYLIVGERLVLVPPTQEGGFDVLGYEWVSKGFIRDLHAWESLFDGGINARCVDQAACQQHVEALRRQPAAAQEIQGKMIFNRMINNVNCRNEKQMLDRDVIAQKAAIEYNGDASRVTNILCSSILYDSVEKLQNSPPVIVETMKKEGLEVVRIVDRFETPLIDGWRDILLNIRYPNGHVGEMQLGLKAFGDIRNERFKLYEEQAAINERRLREDRPFTASEARRILELLEEQNEMYRQALYQL